MLIYYLTTLTLNKVLLLTKVIALDKIFFFQSKSIDIFLISLQKHDVGTR